MKGAAATLASARAESRNPTRDYRGLCLKAVRTFLGVGPRYPSAITAWGHVAQADRHSGDQPPAGVPVFWAVGKYGHIAVSAGEGMCWSTDIKRRGKVDLVPISLISSRWNAHYLGWSETLNGERIRVRSGAAPATSVSVTEVREHARTTGEYVGAVAAALSAENLPATKAGYAHWQRECGYVGVDADGLAGMASLTSLGHRHGFSVTP